MLVAVNMGRSILLSRVLSRRRSMRRLRLASRWRILVFTRNPFLLVVDGVSLPHQTPQKAKGFRVFQFVVWQTSGRFAWLRASFPSMPQPIFDALPTGLVDPELGRVPDGWKV